MLTCTRTPHSIYNYRIYNKNAEGRFLSIGKLLNDTDTRCAYDDDMVAGNSAVTSPSRSQWLLDGTALLGI